MQMSLKPEIVKMIDDLVREGRFASAEEVVEAGVARVALDPQDLDDQLTEADWAAIEESERQIARGDVYNWKDVEPRLRREFLGE